MEKQINGKQSELDEISQTFAKMRDDARAHEVQIGEATEQAIRALLTDWSTMLNLAQMVRSSSSSEMSDRDLAAQAYEDLGKPY